jgi:hypothetical protein
VRYCLEQRCLEQRDPDFAEKRAEVLCVYRQVKILRQAAAGSKKKRPSSAIFHRAGVFADQCVSAVRSLW